MRLQQPSRSELPNEHQGYRALSPDFLERSVKDVIILLGNTINEVRRGQIDPRIANTVGYLSATLLKALEVVNLEKRIVDLEIATKNQSQSDSWFDREAFQFIPGAPDDQKIDPH